MLRVESRGRNGTIKIKSGVEIKITIKIKIDTKMQPLYCAKVVSG